MSLAFYQLRRDPFPLTPDPTLLFLSPSHQAALDTLTSGIATRQGLVTITGEAGLGKSMVLRAYLARMEVQRLTPIVFEPTPDTFGEVLRQMCRVFAVPVTPDAPGVMQRQLAQCLGQASRQGCPAVLFFDEAQDLPRSTLTQLWQWAHGEDAQTPLFQLVLVGRPALLQTLRACAFPASTLRRGLQATIRPLSREESLAYIRQSVAKVALPGGPIFTPEAVQYLVRHADGVPRLLNLLCTLVLRAGCEAQQQPIAVDLVKQVLAASARRRARPRMRRRLVAAAGLGVAAGLLGLVLVSQVRELPRLSQPRTAAPPPPALPAPPPPVPPALPAPPPGQAHEAASGERSVSRAPGEAPVAPLLLPATPTPRSLASPSDTPLPPPTVEITTPRHGATVGRKIPVAGVLEGWRPEHLVFLCVQSQAFGRRIYPQGQVLPDATGHWTVPSIYATPGYPYATFLVYTTDPTSAALLRAPHARRAGLQALPPDTVRLGPVLVVTRE